jgi:hypothetical protein
MADPFVVVGAGAIGGTLGAHLIRAGHPVLLVDANRDHVAAVNENGLTIEGNYSAFRVPARAVTPDALEGPLHRVLIAVKTRHSRDAVELASPFGELKGLAGSMTCPGCPPSRGGGLPPCGSSPSRILDPLKRRPKRSPRAVWLSPTVCAAPRCN